MRRSVESRLLWTDRRQRRTVCLRWDLLKVEALFAERVKPYWRYTEIEL